MEGRHMYSSGVRQQMQVFASDGQRVGMVERVEDGSIRLTGPGTEPLGGHPCVPLAWVETVDTAVYLSRTSDEVAALPPASLPSLGG
jgi:hypothetical protein